ncbi:MAG: hypothetical protein WD851_24595 [Pirellulales bacterium]
MNSLSNLSIRVRRRAIALLYLLAAASASLLVACATASEPIKLSQEPQLFLNDHLIADMRNLSRDVKQPTKHPANPVITPDQPWERRMIELYGTVLFDEDTQSFRCWYLASEHGAAQPEYYICYAESEDGIHWQKPLVGEEPFGPYDQHNIVIRGGHGISVIKEPSDPDPERRYKAAGGDVFGTSPDGIHWTIENNRYAVRKNDTCSSLVRWKDEYLYFVRNQEPETGGTLHDPKTDKTWSGTMRGVGLCTSNDFRTWTEKRSIFRTDERDGFPWVQPHALCVTAYGDALIGLLPIMKIIPDDGNNLMSTISVQLMTSRDGRDWKRVADRAVFMPADKPEPKHRRNWDARFHPGANMFVHDDVVYIYYFGTNLLFGESNWQEGRLRFGEGVQPVEAVERTYTQPRPFGIGLATLPADRFVSLRPVNWEIEGVMQTHPLLISGNHLLVNADVAPADLHVALLDAAGQPVPGFAHENSVAVPHDKLRHRIVWRNEAGEQSLPQAATAKPLALEFKISNGDLYAFQVTE